MENTEDNCQKLAEAVVETQDMKTLIIYAQDRLKEVYEEDKECFNCEWKEYI